MDNAHEFPFTEIESISFIEEIARAARNHRVMVSLTFTPYEDDVIGAAIVEPLKENE
jgi:hypothetical protein